MTPIPRSPRRPPLTWFERHTLSALLYLGASALAMLAIGVVHAEVLPAVRACGIGPAALLTALVWAAVTLMGLSDEVG